MKNVNNFPSKQHHQRVMEDPNLLKVLIHDSLYCPEDLDCLHCTDCPDFSDYPDFLDYHDFHDCPDCTDCCDFP